MFTGIVEETGTIQKITPSDNGIRLEIRMKECGRGLKLGDSIAVNGCCLTAAHISSHKQVKTVRFDLLQETWDRTNLKFAAPGALVNLERSLRADSRLGGHFVTGHIDGLGQIRTWERKGADHLLEITAPAAILRYVVPKGSIAVDGISLTVAAVASKHFRIWIIPHTREVTALRERNVGDYVNLEADMLGKYVEKLLSVRSRKKIK